MHEVEMNGAAMSVIDTDVEVEELSDSVARVPLPLPLAELKQVNCYVIRGSEGITLIDPGWAWPETSQAMSRGLAALGLNTEDIARILVTHAHWDHYSQAYQWKLERGTEILVGRGEHHSIDTWGVYDTAFPLQVDLLKRAGDEQRATTLETLQLAEIERHMDFGPPTTYLDGGETLSGAAVPIEVISTPGHTRGHLVFEADGMLFTGDHVLPRITPSIAYERDPDRMSLRSYLASLQLLLNRPDSPMMPAHGAVTGSVHERVTELLEHHDRRLKIVADLIAAGDRTAHDVASHMTWTRRERTLEELGPEHSWTAVLEAAAHLELLARRGDLSKDATGDVDLYAIV